MKFGARWFRGVVTDLDVSTDHELIWHVVFDDGDECDLNLVELLPILLPEAHLSPPLPPLQSAFLSQYPLSPNHLGVEVGLPGTLPPPWVRGGCVGGDGGDETLESLPRWVMVWGESARGHLNGVPSHLPPLGTRVGRKVGEDGGRVVVGEVRLAERVRLAIVGVGAGST